MSVECNNSQISENSRRRYIIRQPKFTDKVTRPTRKRPQPVGAGVAALQRHRHTPATKAEAQPDTNGWKKSPRTREKTSDAAQKENGRQWGQMLKAATTSMSQTHKGLKEKKTKIISSTFSRYKKRITATDRFCDPYEAAYKRKKAHNLSHVSATYCPGVKQGPPQSLRCTAACGSAAELLLLSS